MSTKIWALTLAALLLTSFRAWCDENSYCPSSNEIEFQEPGPFFYSNGKANLSIGDKLQRNDNAKHAKFADVTVYGQYRTPIGNVYRLTATTTLIYCCGGYLSHEFVDVSNNCKNGTQGVVDRRAVCEFISAHIGQIKNCRDTE